MKKTLILLPIVLFSTIALSGCTGCGTTEEAGVTAISYGTYIQNEGMRELDYGGLKDKFVGDEKGESFILAGVYASGTGCACWTDFSTILKSFVKNEHYVVYTFEKVKCFTEANEGDAASWGLQLPSYGKSALYIVNNGKVVKQFDYQSDNPFFLDSKVFKSEITKYISAPQMYYLDYNDLNKKLIEDKEEAVVHYIWNDCGDCKYCGPHFLVPYMKENTISKKFYVCDIADIKNTYGRDSEQYKSFLKTWKLSEEGDTTFGYGRGFVPTTQYWNNGELKDADVYVNDTVSKVDDKYVVTSSFFTEERKAKLGYLDGIETKVLQGLEIPESDLNIIADVYFSWKHEAACKYHDAFMKAFLNKYAK